MTAKGESNSGCDCSCTRSGQGVSARRAICAGAFGGIVAVVVAAALVAWTSRCCGRSMMERMMRGCECSPETQSRMEKCCCGPSAEDRPEVAQD